MAKFEKVSRYADKEIAKEYPEITTDEWYIDITTAKLIDKKVRSIIIFFINIP